ncbi:MAG: hypothetical protein HC821_01040 [Lewinella sp.]|nr:hypothetical protein [Lewinella sp.]
MSTNRDSAELTYNWTVADGQLSCPDCPNPQLMITNSGTANLVLVDSNGCELHLRQQIFVDRSQVVYLPNVFSPGQLDGFNDRFTLYSDADVVRQINYLRIFDRWGGLVWARETAFPPNDESLGWDGTLKGQAASPALYVLVAEVRKQPSLGAKLIELLKYFGSSAAGGLIGEGAVRLALQFLGIPS